MHYILTGRSDLVHRIGDDGVTSVIIDGSGYPDYQALWDEYQAWLAAGNTPAPYVEPEKPPESTLREKLDTLGIPLADLKAALEALP
jgi:hypothetical protein